MKRILSSLFLGFLFLVFASHNSFAEMCGDGIPMKAGMKHGNMGRMMWAETHIWRQLKGLDLNEKQETAIKEIENKVKKDTIRKRANLQIARVEFKEILHKDPVDMNAVETKLNQIAAIVTDIRFSHIKAIEEVKSQLTPEQKKKFKKNLKKHGRWEHDGTGMFPSCEEKEQMKPEKGHVRH